MENICALVAQCGLGTIKGQILPVSGGVMHKMYKVNTTTGTYAVKCLNPEIMSRPDAMKNYAEAERLEKILEDTNLPIVAVHKDFPNKVITPCGNCRQLLIEYCPDIKVILNDYDNNLVKVGIKDLLPFACL